MKYKELLKVLESLPKERLEDTVTVYDPYEDEYIAVIDTCNANKSILDGQLVLNLKG